MDPGWTGGNARFTTVSFKPLSVQRCGKYCRFSRILVLILIIQTCFPAVEIHCYTETTIEDKH